MSIKAFGELHKEKEVTQESLPIGDRQTTQGMRSETGLRDHRESAPLQLFAGIVEIDGQRAALLICYQEPQTWPILQSALRHPKPLRGVPHDNKERETPIAATQQVAVTFWSRLVRLPKNSCGKSVTSRKSSRAMIEAD
jgi:hypothetical protein